MLPVTTTAMVLASVAAQIASSDGSASVTIEWDRVEMPTMR